MKLTSRKFEDRNNIPSQYTCDGENINPPLLISDVPEDAVELVLIVDDPDAAGGTWVHWTLWNIDPKTQEIKEGSVPEGATQGATSFESAGYGGPCPPSGTHRYYFRLFALKERLELDPSADAKRLMEAMDDKIIDRVELVGLYQRNNP